MKKKILAVLITIVFACFSPFSYITASADYSQKKSNAVFVLPSSIREVRDEAFEATAVEAVIFGEGLLRIEDNIFRKAENLKHVFIPASTEYIGLWEMYDNSHITFYGVQGSYAEKWAKAEQALFIPVNILNIQSVLGRFAGIHRKPLNDGIRDIYSDNISQLHPRTGVDDISKRPQERPELNPIDYKFP